MENLGEIINELEERASTSDNRSLSKWLSNSAKLLKALDERGVQPSQLEKELGVLRKQLDANTQANMIRSFYGMLLEYARKKLNLVPPKYYQNQWIGIGMVVFGIPFGFMFSTSLDNFAFIGIGLPIGLSMGIAIGTEKDKKAKAEGRQLNI
ncbi:MAG: hypothetical protein HWE07_14975 [Cytophagia bacterium]|nr:hypothetical protein [Cytophagia bacterium]